MTIEKIKKEQYCVCGHSSFEHRATLTDLLKGGKFKCHKCKCKDNVILAFK